MRTGTENQITFVFIRHGETKGNQEHRYVGRMDEELSQEGKEKLTEKKNENTYPDVEIVFASPMKRCKETAALLYPNLQAVVIPEWTEMDFGDFEGKNYQELKEDARYQAWIDEGGTTAFPGGESREAFLLRCERGWTHMLQQLQNREKDAKERCRTVGLIVHGGTIMALLSRLCGGGYFDYQVANGEGFVCRMKEKEGKLWVDAWSRI